MKKLTLLLFALVGIILASCNDQETYADQRDRENTAINDWLSANHVKVISLSEFKDKGENTDVSKNEFVLFENTGIYMQIVRKGCGEKLKDGETATVLCRFSETNLITDTVQLTNNILYYSGIVDKMSVKNTSGTFTASFDTSSSLMYTAYGSSSVPAGWLTPLSYILIGRPKNADEEIAKVRLIVPSTQGQSYASANVYPCLYDISYERGR